MNTGFGILLASSAMMLTESALALTDQAVKIGSNSIQGMFAMLPQRVVLSPEALFQEISGEGVILDLKSASYFGLDEVGVRLWQLLQADSSLEAASDTLLNEYNVGAEQLESDLCKLIEQLSQAGLVSVE